MISPRSSSCARLRAQTQGDQSLARYNALPKPKVVSVGFSQRNWRMIPARAKNKRDCECTEISKHFSGFLRDGNCQNGVLCGPKRNDSPHSCTANRQGNLFQLEGNAGELSMGEGEVAAKKHKTGLFLLSSKSARLVIATAHHRLEKTRW